MSSAAYNEYKIEQLTHRVKKLEESLKKSKEHELSLCDLIDNRRANQMTMHNKILELDARIKQLEQDNK